MKKYLLPMRIRASLKLSAIDKNAFYTNPKTGEKWLNIVIVERKSQYSDFMVTQDLPTEQYREGKRGAILGNGKYAAQRPANTGSPGNAATEDTQAPSASTTSGADEDVPF